MTPPEVTETRLLIIVETDDLEPSLAFTRPHSGYVVVDGVPTIPPRDTRMLTTRGWLNAVAGDR